MRNYGMIGDTIYRNQGFKIRQLAYEYKLSHGDSEVTFVYVQNMKELKQQINKIESGYEES